MISAKSIIAIAFTVIMLQTQAELQTGVNAQEPKRIVSWVNSDIPDMPGLAHRVLDSKSLGRDVGYVVWTPPEFDDSGESRYPVIYFLHGAGGSEKSDSAGFASHVAKAIRKKIFPPAICVFPNGGMSGYQGQVESMIVDELIPRIDRSYPTKAHAAGRAVCGFSMGGAGAVHLSIQHPKLFCAAGSWGGALSWQGNGEDSPLLPIAKANAESLERSHYALLTVNGDKDHPKGFDPLKKILEPAGVTHRVVILDDTNHNLGKYYDLASDTMLQFLAQQLCAESSKTKR